MLASIVKSSVPIVSCSVGIGRPSPPVLAVPCAWIGEDTAQMAARSSDLAVQLLIIYAFALLGLSPFETRIRLPVGFAQNSDQSSASAAKARFPAVRIGR